MGTADLILRYSVCFRVYFISVSFCRIKMWLILSEGVNSVNETYICQVFWIFFLWKIPVYFLFECIFHSIPFLFRPIAVRHDNKFRTLNDTAHIFYSISLPRVYPRSPNFHKGVCITRFIVQHPYDPTTPEYITATSLLSLHGISQLRHTGRLTQTGPPASATHFWNWN